MPFGDAALGQAIDETIAGRFDMLLGRRTYEIFAAYWPHQGNSIAKAFNKATKYVVTRSLDRLDWEVSKHVRGDVVDGVSSRVKPNLPKRPADIQACIVLAMFVAGMVSTAVGEPRHSTDSDEQASQSEGPSCPDPSDEGGPCSPSCQCTCCPGHWTGAPLIAVGPSLDIPMMDEFEHSLPGDLHPQDAINRIFHPPRV